MKDTLTGGAIDELGYFLKAAFSFALIFGSHGLSKESNATPNAAADSFVPEPSFLGLTVPLCCGSFSDQ